MHKGHLETIPSKKLKNNKVKHSHLGNILCINIIFKDISFLFTYAILLKINTKIGDKLNLKLFITSGMIFASLFLFSMGLFSLKFENKVLWLIPILMALNGAS